MPLWGIIIIGSTSPDTTLTNANVGVPDINRTGTTSLPGVASFSQTTATPGLSGSSLITWKRTRRHLRSLPTRLLATDKVVCDCSSDGVAISLTGKGLRAGLPRARGVLRPTVELLDPRHSLAWTHWLKFFPLGVTDRTDASLLTRDRMRKGTDGFWLEVRLRLEPPLVGWMDTGGRMLGRWFHIKATPVP